MPADDQIRPTVDAWPGWSGTALMVRGSDVVEELSVGPTGGPGTPPCSGRTRFQACSISKLVLSTMALTLVESRALDLHRPITAWLDDLSAPPTHSSSIQQR